MLAKRLLLSGISLGLFAAANALGQTLPPPPPMSSGTGLSPYQAPATPGTGSATNTLTAPPSATGLPPGSVQSPWVGGVPAGSSYSNQVGGNGPITYEIYFRTGLNVVVGGSPELSGGLRNGVIVGGGGRTLFMNTARDAGWATDLGLSYNYTLGDDARVLTVFTPQATNPQTGNLNGPDELNTFTVRSLFRTTFNYAIGRDWFLNGPASYGPEQTWNSRIGVDVGGRWGTSHVNLIPTSDPTQYLRKSGVTHGVYLGFNWNWEIPLGAAIIFTGVRAEWGVTMMNIIPPESSNLQDVNLLWNIGLRF